MFYTMLTTPSIFYYIFAKLGTVFIKNYLICLLENVLFYY